MLKAVRFAVCLRLAVVLAACTTLPGQVHDDQERRGGLTPNNTSHSDWRGHGVSTRDGSPPQVLVHANVDIDRGGKILVSFRTDKGHTLAFSGSLMAAEGDTLKADISTEDRVRLRGPMYLARDTNRSIYRITFDATNGQEHLHLEWDRK